MTETHVARFRPRARLLLLLGDQLLRDARLAVFELVKNAYDADASEVTVLMDQVADSERGRILVTDDGSGMDYATVSGVWLEPGTDYRGEQRRHGVRTPMHNRLPLGEKGVGRFAAHKLGERIRLITRRTGAPEILVDIDWKALADHDYLDQAGVEIVEREPRTFTGTRSGTEIEIRGLRQPWDRGMTRGLYRSVASISSPFGGPSGFKTRMIVRPNSDWLEGLIDPKDVLSSAPFRAHCEVRGRNLSYRYTFTPPPGLDRVGPREAEQSLPMDVDVSGTAEVPLMVGPIDLDLSIFDLDPDVLALTAVSDKRGLRTFLVENGGIRVYRDGVRVYDYGEPGNDWLNLGARRVNRPTFRISNNQVLGAVSLRLSDSAGLVEKTNREGFVENEASAAFQRAVTFAVVQVERERNEDKERIRIAYQRGRLKHPVLEEIDLLRQAVDSRGLSKELAPMIDAIETQYLDMRDRLMTAAGAGLSLTMVIHEVEKGVSELVRATERDAPMDRLAKLATHLAELIEGLGYLTRRSQATRESAVALVRQALFNSEYRFRFHAIEVVNHFESGDRDFAIKGQKRLLIATLMNLFDNSIYWLGNSRPDPKVVAIGSSDRLGGFPSLYVADNGPGFQDDPDVLTQPFMSRRPDGMGLGLHLASEVMKVHDGDLLFPTAEDIGLDPDMTGAVVALRFRGAEWKA